MLRLINVTRTNLASCCSNILRNIANWEVSQTNKLLKYILYIRINFYKVYDLQAHISTPSIGKVLFLSSRPDLWSCRTSKISFVFLFWFPHRQSFCFVTHTSTSKALQTKSAKFLPKCYSFFLLLDLPLSLFPSPAPRPVLITRQRRFLSLPKSASI